MSINIFRMALVVLFAFAFLSVVFAEKPSPYEALAKYNFPVGILPKGATGYELNVLNGQFKAFLNGSCSFSLEGSYQLNYKSTISGYISANKLTKLSGISVKVLFFWVDIVEVKRKDDKMEFSVGITSASFPIDNFYVCPQCGCGLDCNSVEGTKFRSRPLVSSS